MNPRSSRLLVIACACLLLLGPSLGPAAAAPLTSLVVISETDPAVDYVPTDDQAVTRTGFSPLPWVLGLATLGGAAYFMQKSRRINRENEQRDPLGRDVGRQAGGPANN